MNRNQFETMIIILFTLIVFGAMVGFMKIQKEQHDKSRIEMEIEKIKEIKEYDKSKS